MDWAEVGCYTCWYKRVSKWMWASRAKLPHQLAVLVLGTSQVRLDCTIFWQVQNLGLGAGLEGELWTSFARLYFLLVSMRGRAGVGQADQGGSTCQHTCGSLEVD